VPGILRERTTAAAADLEEVCVLDPPSRPTHEIMCGESGDGSILTLAERDKARKQDMASQAFHIEPSEQKVGEFLFYAYEQADEATEEYLRYPMPYQLAQVKTVTPDEDEITAHTKYTVQWWFSDTGYSGQWRLWRRTGYPKGHDLWPPEGITHAQVVLGSVKFKTGRTVKNQLSFVTLRHLLQLEPNSRHADFLDTKARTATLLAEKTERDKGDLPGETDVHQVAECSTGPGQHRVKPPRRQRPSEWVVIPEAEAEAEEEKEESEESEEEEEEASSPPRKRRSGKAVVGAAEEEWEEEEADESDDREGSDQSMVEESDTDGVSSRSSAGLSSDEGVDSGSDEEVYCETQPPHVPRTRRPSGAVGSRPIGGGALAARGRM
jgi:hypothetical protein